MAVFCLTLFYYAFTSSATFALLSLRISLDFLREAVFFLIIPFAVAVSITLYALRIRSFACSFDVSIAATAFFTAVFIALLAALLILLRFFACFSLFG